MSKALVLLAACVFAAVRPAWAISYEVTDLGSLGGGYTRGLAINASGQVAGEGYAPPSGPPHAFVTAAGAAIVPATDDRAAALHVISTGYALNDSGQLAGSAYFDGVYQHAFRAGGAIAAESDLGTLGGLTSYAYGINASGQVTGSAQTSSITFFSHAYRTTATGAITLSSDLGTLGGNNSIGNAINASGQVTGFSNLATGEVHAFRTTAGGAITAGTDLGTLVPGFTSMGRAINDSGAVAGQAWVTSQFCHAFFVPGDRAMTASDDLGTLGGELSGAMGINNSNWVVGASTVHLGDNENAGHAFIWYGSGSMIDLNTLIPADSGWVLREAHAINDAGTIAGWGYHNGIISGFELTLVPEPASLLLLAGGAAGLLLRRRRN